MRRKSWLPLLRHAGVSWLLLFSCLATPWLPTASLAFASSLAIPRAFLPVVPQFARSPIPVFLPTWLPPIRYKFYPTFCVSRRKFLGPAYELGLYTAPHICDHAHRLIEISGVAGDTYAVNTHTRPVWLGKSGWAYVDPDRNSGWMISFVRSVGHGLYPPEYTYTILGACGQARIERLIACLKHIARSVRRYVPLASDGSQATAVHRLARPSHAVIVRHLRAWWIDPGTHFRFKVRYLVAAGSPHSFPDGTGGAITEVTGIACCGDGTGQGEFFWHNRAFIGIAFPFVTDPVVRVSSPRPGVVDLVFAGYREWDPRCCPTGKPRHVEFRWNGKRLVRYGSLPSYDKMRVALIG